MTIREHFQGIFDRIGYIMLGVVIATVAVWTWGYPNFARGKEVAVSLLGGIALAGVSMLVFRRRFLYPRCGVDLAKLRSQELRQVPLLQRLAKIDGRQFWDRWNACPKCGVSFDAEWRLSRYP